MVPLRERENSRNWIGEKEGEASSRPSLPSFSTTGTPNFCQKTSITLPKPTTPNVPTSQGFATFIMGICPVEPMGGSRASSDLCAWHNPTSGTDPRFCCKLWLAIGHVAIEALQGAQTHLHWMSTRAWNGGWCRMPRHLTWHLKVSLSRSATEYSSRPSQLWGLPISPITEVT